MVGGRSGSTDDCAFVVLDTAVAARCAVGAGSSVHPPDAGVQGRLGVEGVSPTGVVRSWRLLVRHLWPNFVCILPFIPSTILLTWN